jgi:hypothetical protein
MHQEKNLPQQWNEAHRRAETYLRALRGGYGSAERELFARALATARAQHRIDGTKHPVTLMMDSLFAILPPHDAIAPVAMTPPIRRTAMLPERTEFPLHDWLHRLAPKRIFDLAGAR